MSLTMGQFIKPRVGQTIWEFEELNWNQSENLVLNNRYKSHDSWRSVSFANVVKLSSIILLDSSDLHPVNGSSIYVKGSVEAWVDVPFKDHWWVLLKSPSRQEDIRMGKLIRSHILLTTLKPKKLTHFTFDSHLFSLCHS